ncbi:SDR family oxidoreductase [Marvinbryantia formatexigens]|nr:SDR family oxidoreductase [Marvinbryantia formatexigens]UWO26059.1 SDR family oxidoreductase [Marvinbryantia formatexigens DSM 14469]SDF89511.1 Nucleoside-diphosphate-sugar epimerase [Marvinbryantia formatexigens]
MKALFIGGTGTISTAISRKLLEEGHELWLINRGNRNRELPEGAHIITADINDEKYVAEQLAGQQFDVVADFIAFVPEQLERDYRLFKGKTRQYIYISSASAYQKPLSDYRITEGTPLANRYWDYSRNKIAGEELLMKLYREEDFPVTIVRPSHTYSERSVPVGLHGKNGSYQVLKRMMEGKPVLIHGDGTSLWTLTFNSDFAKGFVGLMGNIHAIGEAVQITGDESLTWNQIYQTVADALGVELNPYYVSSHFLAKCDTQRLNIEGSLLGDKAHTVVFDNTKLKKLVPGFCADIRFDQGVRKAVAYVMSHPECQIEDPEFDAWCDCVIEAQEEALKKVQMSQKR